MLGTTGLNLKTMKNYININLAFMNTNLSLQEVAVLSYIQSLSIKKEYCYASNESICNALKINNRTLYRILKRLENKEYIKRVTKSTGRYGKERRIYITPNARLVSSL
jgi:DNA-binding MarR family transcriptional regulator